MNKLSIAALMICGMYAGGYAIQQSYHQGRANAQGVVEVVATPTLTAVPFDAGAPPSQVLAKDAVHDPSTSPTEFIEDIKIAKTKGWFAFILVGLFGLVKLIARYGSKIPFLSKINSGKNAMYIAGIGLIITAAVDALFNGGSSGSVIVAGLWAAVGLLFPGTTKPAEPAKA